MTLPQFFIDFVRRLFAKTPKFYQYIQTAALVVAFIVKLPDFLNQVGWTVPVTQEPYKDILLIASGIAAFLSQLAVSDDSKLKDSINTK